MYKKLLVFILLIFSFVDFSIAQAPVISSFSVSTGYPTTAVTITGSNFTGATGVTFNGVYTTYTVSSSTVISANIPYGASTGTVSVITPNGIANSPTAFKVIPRFLWKKNIGNIGNDVVHDKNGNVYVAS